jgi:hypothetical protein
MMVRFSIDLKSLDQKNAMANIYAALNEAMFELRREVKTLKESLDDPLGTVQKLKSRLDAAYTRNKGLDRILKDLRVEHEALENILWSQAELEDQIQLLGSSIKEKDKEIARISQQTNELRYPRSPQKITEIVNSTNNLTISDKSNTIGKLEKEKSDLSEQLRIAIHERDDEHQKWLTARKDKEIMREVFMSNEYTREQLLEENKALYEQVAGLKAQRQPASSYAHTAGRSPSVGSLQPSRSSMAQVHREQAATNPFAGSNAPRTPVRQSSSSFGNRNFSPNTPARNHRRISSASSLSRPRPRLTRTQERVIATVQQLRDDQLERLESDGAFESVSIKVPGHGHHWVKGVCFSLHFLSSS